MNRRYLVCALLLALGACKDALVATNENSPDRTRVFSNAADLQVFVAGLYAVMHQGTIGGSNDGLQTQMYVLSMESNSGLNNFSMGPRGGIPRSQITNARGSVGDGSNTHDWFREHRAARQAALAYAAIGNPSLGSPALDARGKAFARLVHGIALGNLSLTYDSASIITEKDNPEADAGVIVPLSGYLTVNAAALGYLDSAIAIANANPGSFPIPKTANLWINDVEISQALFIQIARSYQAYIRANVARTPAERATRNWAQVIADATAGITADLAPKMDPTNGWDNSWAGQQYATGSANWHQMSQFWMGMADSSGAYNTWLATPRASRLTFLVVTADRRFPQGTTRALQVTNGPPSGGQSYTLTPYVRNRPSGDQPGDPLQVSMYDHFRSRQLQQASRIGPYPVMTAAVIRLLAAEGYIRNGNYAAAIPLINASRGTTAIVGATARGQLPEIPLTVTDTLTLVPGGVGCVPRVPDAAAVPAFSASKCGNIWDALKWEYRMESMFIMYGGWYLAGRGWGDLPEGSAIQWAVPNQEMDARQQPFYGMGGVGMPGGAAKGNYGLFAGGTY